MKLELVIFGIAGFLIYNSYHDNKYSKLFITYKKYYKIAFIAFTAFSICNLDEFIRLNLDFKSNKLYNNKLINK